MAKSLRSSRNKTNNSKLRYKVCGPVEDARKERLSAKLLELASKDKAKEQLVADAKVEEKKSRGSTHEDAEQATDNAPGNEEPSATMEIDDTSATTSAANSTSRRAKRIEKRGRRKSAASMVFPVYKKGRRIGPRLSARQRKQSLRP